MMNRSSWSVCACCVSVAQAHAPEMHGADPQSMPHTPQFFESVSTLVSHPLAASPSQLPVPAGHSSVHALATQSAGMLGAVGQTWPQAPQWFTSLVSSVSHPSCGSALQSAVPGAHPGEPPLPLVLEAAPPTPVAVPPAPPGPSPPCVL